MQSNTTLEERRVAEREQYMEIQAALVRRHTQVRAQERAILRYHQHHALRVLKQLVAEGTLPRLKG